MQREIYWSVCMSKFQREWKNFPLKTFKYKYFDISNEWILIKTQFGSSLLKTGSLEQCNLFLFILFHNSWWIEKRLKNATLNFYW